MNAAQQSIVESLPHLPIGVEHPQALGLFAVGAAAYMGMRAMYDNKDSAAYVDFANPAVLNEVVHPSPNKARRSTLRDTACAVVGFTALGIGLIGQPFSEQTTVTDKAATVVILDESFSMSNTLDIGVSSRLDAARIALQSTTLQNSQLALVEAGATSVVAMPMTDVWTRQSLTDTLAVKNRVDPNGTQLVDSIKLSSSLLPADAEKKTIVIVSDGTIQDELTDLQAASEKLKSNAIGVKVIAVGTPNANYQLSASSPVVQSGVKTDKLQVLDDNIQVVATSADVNKAVDDVLNSANKVPVRQRWFGLEVAGGILAVFGVTKLGKKGLLGR
ncbi:VWA domain-containing protein [bacterium]|nr:VWA domain-containing protein [bacterium]NBX97711.1 VWA domain-containing protein [bacterium]NDC94216.1 VWA domain-containing protein [bacterium]NDD84405.1 VWA domain-containing protein [bacterium]NDG29721.1 VWA domain-containing protein [bacterium]